MPKNSDTLPALIQDHHGIFNCSSLDGQTCEIPFRHTRLPPDPSQEVPDVGDSRAVDGVPGGVLIYHDTGRSEAARYLAPPSHGPNFMPTTWTG